MSVKALFVVLVLGVVAWPKPGHAEKVKTNQRTTLYSRAGEQSPVVLKVPSGQTMTLLAEDGRWLKVRVSGRTGWIPRSKVDMPEGNEDIVRNTRRRPFVDGRGTKRGFGGEGGPGDRIGADATGDGEDPKPDKGDKGDKSDKGDKGDKGDDEPRSHASRTHQGDDGDGDGDEPKGGSGGDDGDGEGTKEVPRQMAHVSRSTPIYDDPKKDSDESFTAEPKTVLYVGEAAGKWTFVETEEGDAGYVLTSKLEIEEPEAGSGGRMRVMDARGRIGVTLVRQSLTTPGAAGTLPENYAASSSSFTIAIGGTVLYPYKARYWVGGELAYDFDKAVPGIKYMNQSIGFSYHNLNLRAVGGYDLQKKNGMTVYGRLGLHYDSFQVSDVADFAKNTAKLPSQIITAPTLGGALSIPRLTKDLGLKLSLDVILLGARVKQTKNLEDGTDPSARAVFLGGGITYRWKPKMDLQAIYDLSYTSVSFGGLPPVGSMRNHAGTAKSSGADLNHAFSAGIAYAF